MVNYRRNKSSSPDAVYFLTIVTNNRDRLFAERDDFVLLWHEMQRIAKSSGAEFQSWVLLPNHMHWLLKPGDADYSRLVTSIKRGVGIEYKQLSRLKTGSTLWQDRFWEHTVRDEDGLRNCIRVHSL